MKKLFITGLMILSPIVITLGVVFFITNFITTPFLGIITRFISYFTHESFVKDHRTVVLIVSQILALLLCFFSILILGFFGKKFFFSWVIHLTQSILKRLPFIKTVYSVANDITQNLLSQGGQSTFFKQVVAVPFLQLNMTSLGLIAGPPPEEIGKHIRGETHTVFIPTSPHPLSGFLIIYPRAKVLPLEINTEDFFKFTISCGLYHPTHTEDPQ